MSILTNYTLRCLRKNRVRTLVTVIGIILSVALFTAVAEGAYSGQQYLVDVSIAENGAYHGFYEELRDEDLSELRAQPEVTQVETLANVGWALVGDTNRAEPYLRIASMSEGFPELVAVRLKEGRMPENSQELLISDMLPATGASFRVGDRVELTVGRRVTQEGLPLGDYNEYMGEGERLADAHREAYTVVGVYDRFSSDIENYALPGSLALTVGAEGANYKTFFTLESIGNVVKFLDAHPYGGIPQYNRDLRMFSGYSEDENLASVLYGLAAILFVLIFFGSVALIYNSFSISVSERTKQFGLLKSIGATNRQMRRAVLTEALLLCVVGIPLGLLMGCGGIGLTLRYLQDAFTQIVNIDGAEGVTIRLVPYVPALLAAAGIGLLTALVSAWLPARRATRLSPISAIRQSADVKIRAGKVRVSRLTGKLFGFSGTLAAKNFKRSRRQYRSTVISLFLSIVLFISAYSFSGFLRKNVAGNVSEAVPDVLVSIVDAEAFPAEPDWPAMLRQMKALEEVEDGDWAILEPCSSVISPEALNKDIFELTGGPELQSIYFSVFYVPEETYAALCAEVGVDPASGQAVAYTDGTVVVEDEQAGSYRTHVSLLRPEALPISVTLYGENLLDFSEYQIQTVECDEAGKPWRYGCIPPDIILSPEEGFDPNDMVYFLAEDVQTRSEVVIGGLLKELPLASASGNASLYLPLSQKPAAKELDLPLQSDSHVRFFLKAAKHAEACEKVREYLLSLEPEDQLSSFHVWDNRANKETTHAALLILDVFTFGFIILISLIAAANVFNTISTNVALRRREFATLKSVGMGDRAFGRMMRFECLLYGGKALLFGLPVAVGISYLIWKVVNQSFRYDAFRLPWTAMAIAAGSVFLVVFATMLYATGKIRKDNPIDALKTETL
jgi:ABC-type transport system, involved in lipoprotein release, permease component